MSPETQEKVRRFATPGEDPGDPVSYVIAHDPKESLTLTEVLSYLKTALADRYQIERELGQGGMAIVYLARDLRHRRDVALKILKPQLAPLIGADRFTREIEIAAGLSHPHILPLLDSGSFSMGEGATSQLIPYYVMPYVEGESLRSRLDREGKLPADEAIRLARETADALDYAHRQGVVHRDIKPENILLSEGHAVVADFGIARAVGVAGGSRLTATGLAVGTPLYMSPEQVAGEGEADGRSDLYSLGTVLFETLTGRLPFSGDSAQSAMAKRVLEPPPLVRISGAQVSARVEKALARALATRRDDRFATAGEFSIALATTGEVATVSAGSRRARWLGIAAVALIAALLLAQRFLGDTQAPITSLAIMPLSNSGDDSETQYLSDGIHEAVADLLRRLPALTVTAPSLVRQIQRQRPTATTEQLGRELNVGAVLTWDLRPANDSLHVRAELLRIPGGDLLWSSRYDRPARDLLAVQGDIARTISESLKLTLTGEEVETLTRLPTRDPVAYDLYLRGWNLALRSSPLGATLGLENTDSALKYANQALARDPNFASGYMLRSALYISYAFRGWRKPFGPVADTAWADMERAFALDSTLAMAWSNRGQISLYLTDDWPSVRRDLSTAVRLDSDHPWARMYYGIYLGEFEGQLDSAITHLQHAVAIDPQPFYNNTLGDLLMRARRYPEAIGALREALRVDAGLPGPRSRLIQSYERTGQWREALEARRQAPDTTRLGAFTRAFTAEGASGYRRVLEQEVRARVDSMIRGLAGPRNEVADTVPPLQEARIALLFASLDDWPSTMEWTRRALQRRPRQLRWFVVHPDLAGLRTNPEFLALVRQADLDDLLRRVSESSNPIPHP
jgi:serine/threonine-protein kinase